MITLKQLIDCLEATIYLYGPDGMECHVSINGELQIVRDGKIKDNIPIGKSRLFWNYVGVPKEIGRYIFDFNDGFGYETLDVVDDVQPTNEDFYEKGVFRRGHWEHLSKLKVYRYAGPILDPEDV